VHDHENWIDALIVPPALQARWFCVMIDTSFCRYGERGGHTMPQTANPRVPVATEVHKIIKSQIVSLQLMPGQLLMVQQLAKDMGVSRTPIREALVILCDEGLVAEADGRKFRVSDITWKLIDDIYMARKVVEMVAVEHVTQNAASIDGIIALDKLVEKMEAYCTDDSFTEYLEADRLFHATLVELLGNQVITGWMSRIQDQQQRIRYLTTGVSSRIGRSCREHAAILKAIRSANVALAKSEMENHLDRAYKDVIEFKNNSFSRAANLIRD